MTTCLPSVNLVFDVTEDFLVRARLVASHHAPRSRQSDAGRHGQRVGQQPHGDLGQSVPRSVQGRCDRRRVRMVLRRRVAAGARAVPQGHQHVPAERVRDAAVHGQRARACRTASRSRRAAPSPAARRPPTGCSRSRSTATAAISTATRSRISRRSRTASGLLRTTRTSTRRSTTSIRRRRAASHARPARAVARRVQRDAVLRNRALQRARLGGRIATHFLTTMPGRNSNDVEGTDETLNFDLAATLRRQRQPHADVRGHQPHGPRERSVRRHARPRVRLPSHRARIPGRRPVLAALASRRARLS